MSEVPVPDDDDIEGEVIDLAEMRELALGMLTEVITVIYGGHDPENCTATRMAWSCLDMLADLTEIDVDQPDEEAEVEIKPAAH